MKIPDGRRKTELLRELKRIEKAKRIQRKIVEKKRIDTKRAEIVGTLTNIEKAQAEEDKARAILEQIHMDEIRIIEQLEAKETKIDEQASDVQVVEEETPVTEVPEPEEELEEEEEEEEEEDVVFLERYPVNEPYAYVTITATTPPVYKVSEVKLTKGEKMLLEEIKTRLYESLDVNFTDVKDPYEILKEKVDEIITDLLKQNLSPESMERILYYIKRDFIDYGKLDPIIRDTLTEDISVDGPGIPLYVYHRNQGSIESNVVFEKGDLDSTIYKLAQRSGRHISLSRPLLSATLPNRDRVQLSLGSEVTTKGSTITIRRFKEIPITPIELVNYGTFSLEMMAYLWMAVEGGFNILISGATASGKTTTLNAVSMFIPPESKVVSIEDTREINLMHKNWIPGVTRVTEEGGSSIEMFDLLKAALRQRPEYVLVGEVRGIEAYTLFQAMATGHITLSTVHADSAEAIVRRLTKPPIDVPLMLLDSLDVITIQRMVKVGEKGVRRCVNIIEVMGVDFESGLLKTNDLFSWRPDTFLFTGESKVFYKIMDRLVMNEKELAEEFARRIKILDWMRRSNMDDFESLSEIVFEQSTNPSEVERMMMRDAGTK